jgi:T-complex protein 1 subunit theta
LRNITACKEISKLTKSGLGPNGKKFLMCKKGMKKMVINHLEKIFITSDAGTIMKEVSFSSLFLS